MEQGQFESLYPANSYTTAIEKLFEYIKTGNSVQIIGMPGAGKSILLGLLSYNRNIRIAHVSEKQEWYHFVLCNFAEVKGRNLFDVTKFLFLALADSLRDRGLTKEHDSIHKIFKEHLDFNDEIVLFQGLKEAINYLAIEKELTIIFSFDRFDAYIHSVTPEFFDNLRVLRNRAKYRFSVLFSLSRPLEELIEPTTMSDFYELVVDNQIYLPLLDQPTLNFRISYLEKATGKKADPHMLEDVKELTGGQGKLTRLALEQLFSTSEYNSQSITKSELTDFLLKQRQIIKTLEEIWQIFTPAEQEYMLRKPTTPATPYLQAIGIIKDSQITIPLFKTYIAGKKDNQEKQSQQITFHTDTNTITKGTAIISDKLTSAEFRLLKFLLLNKEKIIEREDIIAAVWQNNQSTMGVTDQAVDQLIFRLRKKIEQDINNPSHLQTIKGRGFRFQP